MDRQTIKNHISSDVMSNIIKILITILLSVLTFVSILFCEKSMSNETRIVELENQSSRIEQQYKDLDRRITEIKIDIGNQLDKEYTRLKDLIIKNQ